MKYRKVLTTLDVKMEFLKIPLTWRFFVLKSTKNATKYNKGGEIYGI